MDLNNGLFKLFKSFEKFLSVYVAQNEIGPKRSFDLLRHEASKSAVLSPES